MFYTILIISYIKKNMKKKIELIYVKSNVFHQLHVFFYSNTNLSGSYEQESLYTCINCCYIVVS